jgi:hypothetical protein
MMHKSIEMGSFIIKNTSRKPMPFAFPALEELCTQLYVIQNINFLLGGVEGINQF